MLRIQTKQNLSQSQLEIIRQVKFINLNVVFTRKASRLGGKPVVHSYAVILMLLGLFPEKFQDFYQSSQM